MSEISKLEKKTTDWDALETCIMFTQDDGEGKIASKAADQLASLRALLKESWEALEPFSECDTNENKPDGWLFAVDINTVRRAAELRKCIEEALA